MMILTVNVYKETSKFVPGICVDFWIITENLAHVKDDFSPKVSAVHFSNVLIVH